jgi:precorrin-6A/cobalt-precorrin-6A reductase
MHGPVLHQRARPAEHWVWLFSGTADGPPLAQALLARGWQVLVSVVTVAATRAYRPHPSLHFQVGTCSSDAELEQQLRQLTPRWVVDATHPFALEISARLERLCRQLDQPLLRLDRREASETRPGERLELLEQIEALSGLELVGEHVLLAIGARQLPAAIAATPHCRHFARVLDQPGSLQAARAAGLPDHHIACLRPDTSGEGQLEEALCRRWQIDRVLCRQGGGRSEQIWRQVCRRLQLPLLLLRRPTDATGLRMAALLEKLGQP